MSVSNLYDKFKKAIKSRSLEFRFLFLPVKSSLLSTSTSLPPLSRFLLSVGYLLPVTFLLVFYFYPLMSIFNLSFAPEGQFELAALEELITTSYFFKTLWFTIWQATLSTLLTLGLALPAAYIFARYRFPGKTLLRSVTTIPFVLPTIVVANAFTALFGPKGAINMGLMSLFQLDTPPLQFQHTIGMILLAHIFYNYTIVLRLVGGFWANLNPHLAEAGQMLGAKPWAVFRHVTLPLLAPVIGAAALLIFIFSFTSFGVILILGGPRYATLEVEIYRQAVNLFNLPVAAGLSLIQIIFVFALMLTFTRLQARTSHPLNLQSRQSVERVPQSRRERLIVWGNIGFMLTLLGTPLAALIIRSFMVSGQISFIYYRTLMADTHQSHSIFFVPPSKGIANSLTFALSTVLLATLLGLLIAVVLTRPKPKDNIIQRVSAEDSLLTFDLRQRLRLIKRQIANSFQNLFDTIFMLPLATSAVTLGFGYIITMNSPPLNLRTSPILIVIAHTLVALPFVIRSVLPALRSIQPALREAAAILGATPARVWREIDLPIAGRALLVGAVFAFTISVGEFGATLFIARPDTPTMPVAIFRFLAQPGALNYGQALAMSSLLMLVCGLGFVFIERFRVSGGEF